MPDRKIERRHQGVVAGVDEAGRGPLAGPVVAGAVILPKRVPSVLSAELDDSKKLSERKRALLYDIVTTECRWAVGVAEVEEIDRLNILRATFLAMDRAVRGLGCAVDCALVDGNQRPPLDCATIECVVGGDGLSLSIAAASIIAKVTRDRLMAELAAAHPGYGWESNAGYGTREHLDGLRRLGVTPHHRRSFEPIRLLLAQTELPL